MKELEVDAVTKLAAKGGDVNKLTKKEITAILFVRCGKEISSQKLKELQMLSCFKT
jgi:hypothetical protein